MTAQEQTFSQKIIRGGLIITFFSLLTSPLGYFIRLMLSRALTIEEYGLFYSILGFFGIFIIFNDLGFGYSVAYFTPKFIQKKQYHKAWNAYLYDLIIELTTSLLLSVLFLIFSEWLSTHYFKIPQAKELISIFSLFFVSNSFVSALQKFFTGVQSEKFYSSMEFVRLFITAIFILVLWLQGSSNLNMYALSWVTGYVTVALLYTFFQYQYHKKYITKLVWDKTLFSIMFQYAVPTLLVTSLAWITNYIDVFSLTLLKDVREVGVYNVVFPLAGISGFLFSPIQVLFLPLISQYHGKDDRVVAMIINKLLLIVPLLGLYVCFFIFLNTEAVIGILFGNQWIESALLPLKVLSLGYPLQLLAAYLATIISGLGKITERFKIVFVSFSLHVISCLLLTYFYGVLGTVISNCIVYFLLCYWYLKIIKTEVRLKIPWQAYAKTLGILALIAVFFTYFNLSSDTFFEFIGLGVVYSIIFVAGSYFIHFEELQLVGSFLQSFNKWSNKHS